MAQIGSFTRGEDGVFAGTIKTLSLNVKARLVPADTSSNEKAPDLRVLVGNVEIGAAWRRTSKENTEYHSVKLDDPSFPAPIYANLFKGETGAAEPPSGRCLNRARALALLKGFRRNYHDPRAEGVLSTMRKPEPVDPVGVAACVIATAPCRPGWKRSHSLGSAGARTRA